jgi:acyl dehydratase
VSLDWSAPFEALAEGATFQTDAATIAESDVIAFAELTGDRHPQHVDEQWATSSSFGQRIVHGMLVLSRAVGLVPLDPDRVVALRRLSEVVFKRPVLLGDTIHVRGSVQRLRRVSDEAGLVGCRWEIVNQRAELVARADVEVLWRTSAAAAVAA